MSRHPSTDRGDVTEELVRLDSHRDQMLELTEDREHPSGAVNILHVILLGRWRHFAQVRDFPAEAIDVGHGEIHARLVRRRQ